MISARCDGCSQHFRRLGQHFRGQRQRLRIARAMRPTEKPIVRRGDQRPGQTHANMCPIRWNSEMHRSSLRRLSTSRHCDRFLVWTVGNHRRGSDDELSKKAANFHCLRQAAPKRRVRLRVVKRRAPAVMTESRRMEAAGMGECHALPPRIRAVRMDLEDAIVVPNSKADRSNKRGVLFDQVF